jgi:hypothetical protein
VALNDEAEVANTIGRNIVTRNPFVKKYREVEDAAS